MGAVFDPFSGNIILIPGSGGGGGGGAASNVQIGLKNNTGSTIAAGTPVCLDSSGELKLVDVTSSDDANSFMGLVYQDIADGDSGTVLSSGKLLEVTTTALVGDGLWVSKSGGITNVGPSDGVNSFVVGDWVIKIGAVAKNLTNASNKDIIIISSVVGQL